MNQRTLECFGRPRNAAWVLTAAALALGACSQQQRRGQDGTGEAGLRGGRDVASTSAGAGQDDAAARDLAKEQIVTGDHVTPDYESETTPVSEPAIPGERYDAAFAAAQQTLRDLGFLLERVDAHAGVITTRAKTTGGIATIWHREQASVRAEFEDALHRQRRTVRIEFAPPTPSSPTTPPVSSGVVTTPAPGGAGAAAETHLRVRVIVERMNRPLRRIDADSITSSTFASDPYLPARGMESDYAVPFAEDRDLAQWITDEIVERSEAADAEPAANPAENTVPRGE